MTADDKLRDLLREEADRVRAPEDAWDRLGRAAAAAPSAARRYAVAATAILAAAAAIAALVLLGPVRDDERHQILDVSPGPSTTVTVPTTVTTLPSTTAPPTTAAPTTTAAPAQAMPGLVIASTRDGRIAEVDSASGRIVRVLARFPAPGPDAHSSIGEVAPTPDGSAVYFAREAGSAIEIWRVGRQRGAPVRVTEGMRPRVSPDGRRLAYVVTDVAGEDPSSMYTLVVRDLATGVERRIGRRPGQGPDEIADASWAPDSRRLVLHLQWENLDYFQEVDVTSHATIDDGRTVEFPSGRPRGAVWRRVAYRSADEMVLTEECCLRGDYPEDEFVAESAALIVAPSAGGRPSTVLQSVDKRTQFESLSVDVSGRHVTYVTRDGALWVWGGGAPRRLGSGFLRAAWPAPPVAAG